MAQTPRQFVASWLSMKKITIDARGSLIVPTDSKATYLKVFDTMVLDYCEQIKAEALEQGKRPYLESEANLKKALDELIHQQVRTQLLAVVESVKCEIDNEALIKKYMLALTGKDDALVTAVMSHWLWQVKRKLNDLPVVYQIMPILYGPQGAGKSMALQKLLSPIANLTLDLSLTEITDARFYFSLNENYVVILDEMAGAKRADVEALKRQITATHNDVRALGRNTVVKLKQNTSLIGTTNRPVGELIYDTTGARRFFQVDILPKADWEAINALDYVALFRSIDESRPRGYIEAHLEALTEAQSSLVGKDEVTAFFEHHQIDPASSNTKEILCSEFYSIYTSWCESNGINRPDNSLWFGKRLKQRGIKGLVKTSGGKTSRMYLINKESTVHAKVYDSLEAAPPVRKGNA